MPRIVRSLATLSFATLMAIAISGCATTDDEGDTSSFSLPKLADFNPFQVGKQPLPGQRVSILTEKDTLTSNVEAAGGPVSLPPPVQNSEWATSGGNAGNSPGHLALVGNLRTVWTADIGTGSSSAGKVTASPIIHQGRIYALDAAGTVSAYSLSGARAWSVSLAPESESAQEGFGGGIAADGGRIFAVTGYGTAVALDAASGAKLWEQKLGVPVRTAPTAADGRVIGSDTDGQVFCLSANDGSALWTYHGSPQQSAGILKKTAPAIAGDQVIVPFVSGDLVALKIDSGTPVWTDSVNGARASATIASLSDPSSPAVEGGSVYAVSRSGRMIATNQRTGERLWSLPVNGVEMPWIAGDSVYVVDITGKLAAINRATGELRWAAKLPGTAKAWSGPVLAGSRLWLVSSKGQLVGVDPTTGQVAGQRDLGQPVYIAPVVADGRMYILTDRATLMALE